MPDKLTATEQEIVEYITGHRDEFLYMTIGQLSAALDVSEATISRFARHVGCCDFKHLKRVVIEQTVQKGPAQKLTNTLQMRREDFLNDWMEQQQYNLQKTLELLDQDEFSRAVKAIRGAHRVFLYAKNASRAPAQLLEFRLGRIGIDVRRIPSGGSELLESLSSMCADDLVILFGFSKVSAEGRVILNYQKRAGFKTILFTSRVYHDEKHRADINLFVYRGEESEYHSMSAPIAVVDALVLALSAQMGTAAVDRLEAIRKMKIEYGKQL
ncbi:MAG: MurR/RpiR family transcriptional regulator [Fusicatenibacter sp.]